MVLKMMTPNAKADLCRGDEVKIVLVQDNAVKTGRPGYVSIAQ